MVLFTNVYVGQTVEVFWGRGIFRGTVQYKGSVATKRGDWVGVTLDRPVGENNGMLFGRRYFQCRDKHGVFVRADKIRFIPSVRCLYDRYHKVADSSYIEEPLFTTSPPEVKNGPYDPVRLSAEDFKRVHSSLGDYSMSSALWGKPRQFHLRHAVGSSIPAATMLRPDTAMATFRYRSSPFHTQYSIEDDFVSRPTIPKTHMPHSALVQQVKRGWGGAHYVREMSVGTGRDAMKFGQWNDISP
ncbi:hypothetical protein BaRGS_00009558 [Batillaria attramentaria]|uniref:CAP-Gly domain-containing protein n=1 Tax=Batillaria attramentaria TaxID=370345 RepID=A0ABD0LIQ1_9CAEN